MKKTVDVLNMATGKHQIFIGLLPSEAVIYAYLQNKGNHNTWDYEKLYFDYYPKLSWGKISVSIGDFATRIN